MCPIRGCLVMMGALAAGACLPPPSIATAPFRCEVDSACGADHVCRDGVCQRRGTFEVEPGTEPVPFRGDGTYLATSAAVGNGTQPAVADVDGDGRLDVFLADDNTVLVLKGRGDRTFGPELARLTMPEGADIGRLVVADFNGDGRVDVAVASLGVNQVSLAPATGNGSFGAWRVYPIGNNIRGAGAADYTGDGIADLFILSLSSNRLIMLKGEREGGFGAPISNAVGDVSGGSFAQYLPADFDGDGKMDIVVSELSPGTLVLWRGDGTGAVKREGSWNLPCSLANGDRASIGAFGANRQPGVLMSCSGSTVNGLVIFSFSGGATLASTVLPLPTSYAQWGTGRNAVAADLNADALDDVVLPDGTVVLNSPTGFTAPRQLSQLSSPYQGLWQSLAAGDFDGDGAVDVLGLAGPIVQVAAGDNAGGLGGVVESRYGRLFLSAPTGGDSFAAADFNEDGRVDVAMSVGVERISVVAQPGRAAFSGGVELSHTAVDVRVADMAAADLDRDGHSDLVVIGSTAARVLLGRGDGTFAVEPLLPLSGLGTDLAVVDVNEDAFPDVLVAIRGSSQVDVFLNAGAGALVPFSPAITGRGPFAITTGDLTGDGHLDLLVCRLGPSGTQLRAVTLLAGDGEGHFGEPIDLVRTTNVWTTAVGDFNRDGLMDFVAAQTVPGFSQGLVLHQRQGDGTFEPVVLAQPSTLSSVGRHGLSVYDVNRDGLLDVGLLSHANWWVQLGAPTGLTGPTVSYKTLRSSTSGVAFFDVNGDGFDDVVSVRSPPGLDMLIAQ